MPNYRIVDGRKKMNFDDLEERRFYLALHALGDDESTTAGFDVNNPADLKKIGIITMDPNTQERTIYHPFPQDFDAFAVDNKIVYTEDGEYHLEARTAEEKQAYQNLQKENPIAYEEEKEKILSVEAENLFNKRIRTMMNHVIVLYDKDTKEYPRELNYDSESLKATVIDAKEGFSIEERPKKPETPEKPSGVWFSIKSFVNRISGGRFFKDVPEKLAEYDTKMDAYHDEMAKYAKDIKKLNDRTLIMETIRKDWPDVMKEGVHVQPKRPTKAPGAIRKLDQLEKNMSEVENNILAVFSREPEKLEDASDRVYKMVDAIDQKNITAVPKGLSKSDAAVITHLALYSDDILFENAKNVFPLLKDHEIIKSRTNCLASEQAHLYDVQFGRPGEDGTQYFTREWPKGNLLNQAHKKASEAFEAWNQGDRNKVGKIVADSAVILTRACCRSSSGSRADSIYSAMVEADMLYEALKDPKSELTMAAKENGLSKTVMQELKANHNVLEVFKKGLESEKILMENKNMTFNERRDHVANLLISDYMNGIMVQNYRFNLSQHDFASSEECMNLMATMPGDQFGQYLTLRNLSDTVMLESCKDYRNFGNDELVSEMKESMKTSDTMKNLLSMKGEDLAEYLATWDKTFKDLDVLESFTDMTKHVKDVEDKRKDISAKKVKVEEKNLEQKKKAERKFMS